MTKDNKSKGISEVNEEKSFLVADTFLHALEDLNPSERRATLTAVENFRHNPAFPSLRFHRLNKLPQGTNFWSARVNDDIRLIIHKIGPSHMICYVGKHDDSYKWAETRKIEEHSINQGTALILLREMLEAAPHQSKDTEYSMVRNLKNELEQAREDLEIALNMAAQAEEKVRQLESQQLEGLLSADAEVSTRVAECMGDDNNDHWIAIGPAAKKLGIGSRRIMTFIEDKENWHDKFAISRRNKKFGAYNFQETWCIHVEFLQELGNVLKKSLAEKHLVNKSDVAMLFGIAINHPDLTSLFDTAREAYEAGKPVKWREAIFHCEERTAVNGKGRQTLYVSKSDIVENLPSLLGMDFIEPDEEAGYIPATEYAPQILHCSFQTARQMFDEINAAYKPGHGKGHYLGNDKSKKIKVKKITSKGYLYIHKESADLIREYLGLPQIKTDEWLTPPEVKLKAGITLQAARRLCGFAEEFWRAAKKTCADVREIKLLFHGTQLVFSERAYPGATGSQRWEKSMCVKSAAENDLTNALYANGKMRNITAASLSGPV